MRLTRRAEITRIIAEIAALILLIISLVRDRDWFGTYKWWLLGGLGILVLGDGAYHYFQWRQPPYVVEPSDRSKYNITTSKPRGVVIGDPNTVTIIRDFYDEGSSIRSAGIDTTDPVVIPHKATPKIAITSGLLAVMSLSTTMVLITNFKEATTGLIVAYVAVAVLGITSFGLGLLAIRTRAKVLNSLRSEWQRLQEKYEGSRKVPDQVQRHIAEQRDALLISGDSIDADRAAVVLRSLQGRGPGPELGL